MENYSFREHPLKGGDVNISKEGREVHRIFKDLKLKRWTNGGQLGEPGVVEKYLESQWLCL